MMVKGDASALSVEETQGNDTKKRLPMDSAVETQVLPALSSATVIFRNGGEEDVSIWYRDVAGRRYVYLDDVNEGSERKVNTFRSHQLLLMSAGLVPDYDKHPPNHYQDRSFEVNFYPDPGTFPLISNP